MCKTKGYKRDVDIFAVRYIYIYEPDTFWGNAPGIFHHLS